MDYLLTFYNLPQVCKQFIPCKNGTAACFLMFAWHASRYRCIKLICLTLHSILVIS